MAPRLGQVAFPCLGLLLLLFGPNLLFTPFPPCGKFFLEFVQDLCFFFPLCVLAAGTDLPGNRFFLLYG
jgi:hypothetical protein